MKEKLSSKTRAIIEKYKKENPEKYAKWKKIDNYRKNKRKNNEKLH